MSNLVHGAACVCVCVVCAGRGVGMAVDNDKVATQKETVLRVVLVLRASVLTHV